MKSQQIIKSESQNRFICRELAWDTDYFGVTCARLDLYEELNDTEKESLEQWLHTYEFVTISNNPDCIENNEWIANTTTAFITDSNVQFDLRVKPSNNDLASKIKVSNDVRYNQDIVDISNQSFTYSRFLNDKHISREQGVGIYTNWVSNAFNREDKYFSVYTTNESVSGFILFSIQDLFLTIELIACSPDAQYLGIGSCLIDSVNDFAFKNNITNIKVGTQVENIKAVNFYMKNQFKLCNVRYIYHLWNK